MAIMIPKTPRDYAAASQEGLMFEALSLLSDEYYVFHSFALTRFKGNTIHQEETDFLIFHPAKGIICIEAKSGRVRYEQGQWLYSSGIPMKHGGPFNQANRNKFELMDYIKDSRLSELVYKCKFLHAVWFPTLTDADAEKMPLPSEADRKLIITREALTDPEKYINRVFEITLPSGVVTRLSTNDTNRLIKEILCPSFNVFPSVSPEIDIKKIRFHRLLREQSSILDFLVEQQTAVINGAAGTGKTVIALEKAKRHAEHNEKVLFLCYNNKLKDYLTDVCIDENIDFFTIAGLACKLCNTLSPDYEKLTDCLETMYCNHSFPYKHIIVDEGQDFGIDNKRETDILETLKVIITDNEVSRGTFYVFYDRLQMVQAKKMSPIIDDADCRLTLYKNCRNTINIATTSLIPIGQRTPEFYDGCVRGLPTKIHFTVDSEKMLVSLNNTIESLKTDTFSDIVILTSKTEDNSIISDFVSDGKYQGCLFTTCRKFKGLEADAVIMIDVDQNTFEGENALLFYVGASRARLRLEIITALDDEACTKLLKDIHYTEKIRKPRRELTRALHADGVLS